MRKLLLTYIILWVSIWAQAQVKSMPYSCSFEEDEDLSAWVLNASATPNATDKWIIGSSTHSEGQRSLYISSDGHEPNYGNQPNIVVSYLRVKFPTTENPQEGYDISFDWRGLGDSTKSKLYVMICPEPLLTINNSQNYYNLEKIVTPSSSGLVSLSNDVINGVCQPLGESGERFVCGSERWLNADLVNTVEISRTNSSKYTYALVFVWVNSNKDENVHRSGICIDNVQISSSRLKKPKHLTVEPHCEDSTFLVSWDGGSASMFEVQYRTVGSATWRRADGIQNGVDGFTRVDGTKCSYVLRRIVEGTYDVRVRSMSGSLMTNFVYKSNVFVYCPDNHCINYVDLYSPNVECTFGYHPLTSGHAGETPYTYPGIIDFGPESQESRHTLHTDPNETDPRTDDCLHTVRPGALASVRLGNWKVGGEAESITYSIVVDAENQGLLIVHYAVVLQEQNHPPEQETSFSMEVLDENGNLIDESCGLAEFTYSEGVNAGWNRSKSCDAAWKDWTTVGVDLQPYGGQTIKVRFTTYDCSPTGHFGYAYFTLDCVNAHIETDNCGNDAKITCNAPEGFTYKWTKEDGTIVSTSRELEVDASRQTYTCELSFIEQPDCKFTVSMLSAPRFPVPEFKYEPIYAECMSKLKFTNTSHVMNKFDGEENHTQEPCNDCHWIFRRLSDGTTTESYNWSPIYLCPEEGDTIEVTLTSYIGAENSCDSTITKTIVVPDIRPVHTHWGSKEAPYETCPETPVFFDGKFFDSDTTYVATNPNFAGCDSTSTLYLKVHPKIKDLYLHDSICSNMHFYINGEGYNQPMDSQLFMLKSIHGCDSAVYVTLTVNQLLNMEMTPYSYSCADDESFYIAFDVSEGQFDSLQIRFDTPLLHDTTIFDPDVHTLLVPIPDSIQPGYYMATLIFYQYCCGTQTQYPAIEIRYKSSIVEQKWNDVLTLLNPDYNGGYEFTAIQWYKNGQPIEGETHSYLYQQLDTTAVYQVQLTNADSLTVFTCPITPVYHEQKTPFPTIVQAGQQLPVYMNHPTTVWYYTVAGQLYASFDLPRGYSTLNIPAQHGVYVLKATNQTGETQAQVMIVE